MYCVGDDALTFSHSVRFDQTRVTGIPHEVTKLIVDNRLGTSSSSFQTFERRMEGWAWQQERALLPLTLLRACIAGNMASNPHTGISYSP